MSAQTKALDQIAKPLIPSFATAFVLGGSLAASQTPDLLPELLDEQFMVTLAPSKNFLEYLSIF